MSFPGLVLFQKILKSCKMLLFSPVRPFHLSSLVRMEAGGLATVADYWYEPFTFTLTGNFISIWICLIRNVLIRPSFYLAFLDFSSSGCNFKASVQRALLCSTALIPWLLLDEQSCDISVFWFWCCFFLLFSAQRQRPEAPRGLLHRQPPGLLRPLLKGRWSSLVHHRIDAYYTYLEPHPHSDV